MNGTRAALEASREKAASLWDWTATQPLVLLRAGGVIVGEASPSSGKRGQELPCDLLGLFQGLKTQDVYKLKSDDVYFWAGGITQSKHNAQRLLFSKNKPRFCVDEPSQRRGGWGRCDSRS